MKGPGGKGQGKPGRGKGKGEDKGKDKGKGKGSGAGVGSTYPNLGRPKNFQPTQQDRQRTGNITEYFRRAETTPQPVALASMIKILPSGMMPNCRILWCLK
jgi:hypothetical protein